MTTTIKSNMKLDALITDPAHLVNKEWVELLVSGKIKDPVDYATTAALPACTYAGTPAFTLTGDANGALTAIDGQTPVADDRILIKNQVDATQNGIYDVTTVGDAGTAFVLTRSSDMNASQDLTHNLVVPVIKGTAQADARFELTTDGTLVLDTSLLVFQKYYTTSGVQKYAETITGDAVLVAWTITHNLNTEDISIKIYDSSDNEIFADGKPVTVNTASVTFDVAPANGATYRVIVMG